MDTGLAVCDVRSGREFFWREHMAALASSGLPVRIYCESHGLSLGQFYWWRRELRRRDGIVGPKASFAQVRVTGPLTESASIEVLVGCGRRVLVRAGFDEATLARVVSVLERA